MNTHMLKRLVVQLALVCLGSSMLHAQAAICTNMAIPAYFYPSQPTSQWNTAVSDAPLPAGRQRILIMDVTGSGPGTTFDQNYLNASNLVHSAGTGFLVYGYVITKYGHRSISTVETDIDHWFAWYNVDGIFLDTVASSASYIGSYYQPLVNYITSKKTGAGVMLNPGVYPDQAYFNITVPSGSQLIINTFESSYSNYLTTTVPSWAYGYPKTMSSHLVYSTTAAQMPNAVSLSSQRNAGWVYVTDMGGSNPWAALPSYWSSLVTQTRNCP